MKKLGSVLIAVGLTASGTSMAQAQDATKGKTLFGQRCAMCHTVDPAKKSTMGPNLAGVAGRKVAAQPDFNYSPALRKLTVNWSKQNLETFLAGPAKMAPGTRMPISIPSPTDRADIAAYLGTLKAK